MLDIKFIRENQKLIEEKSDQKGFPVNLAKLLETDEKRRQIITKVDGLRADRKEAAEKRDEKKGAKIKKELKEAYLKGDALTLNFLLREGALRERDGISWPNFAKMFFDDFGFFSFLFINYPNMRLVCSFDEKELV